MNKVQRHTWEDALIEAEGLGVLPTGAVNFCLRLARAITWAPKSGGPSELRWKNETAFKSVNQSRATYFRYRQVLIETGFITQKNGNLLPLVPDLSQVETNESQVETVQSQVETTESQLDTPYSVDTYSEDLFSVDKYNEEGSVVADAPTDPWKDYRYIIRENGDTLLNGASHARVYFLDLSGVTKVPESQVETAEDAKNYWLTLNSKEREYFERVLGPKEKVDEAVRLYRLGVGVVTGSGEGFYDRASKAVKLAGIEVDEW